MTRPRIAIVGTGVAGMAAGYFLRDRYEVHFFEKNRTPGGHTNTVTADENGRTVPIDTGFMVYNEATYPNLVRFFRELSIPTQPTSMSFSVQHRPSGLEYCGTGVLGLFAQRRNALRPSFWRLLGVIDRFNRECPEVLEDPRYAQVTLAEYCSQKGFSTDFLEKYLVPMSSAIWSTPPDLMLRFPAATLVRFFKNHGLLGLHGHFTWRTVAGGSRVYRDKVLAMFGDRVRLGDAVVSLTRGPDGVDLRTASGASRTFATVVVASHADESLALLADATPLERELLSKFRYQRNRASLHTDGSVMPVRRRAWSSWNYRIDENGKASTAYWMNHLQNVSERRDYFVSINDSGLVKSSSVLWETEYEHPIYDSGAVDAQRRLPELNVQGPVYFCGSYFRYGFHEDAFTSGLEAARSLSGEALWT